MEVNKCKFCFGDKFTHHEEYELYDPDTDEVENISNVNVCDDCGSVYYETDTHYVAQLNKDINNIGKDNTPNIGKYMNS